MRVIITGAMAWKNKESIRNALAELPKDTVVIHGDSSGADALGGEVARELGFGVEKLQKNKEDYKRYGRGVWKALNERMLASGATLVLAFHPGLNDPKKARGTRHMIKLAEAQNVETRIFLE